MNHSPKQIETEESSSSSQLLLGLAAFSICGTWIFLQVAPISLWATGSDACMHVCMHCQDTVTGAVHDFAESARGSLVVHAESPPGPYIEEFFVAGIGQSIRSVAWDSASDKIESLVPLICSSFIVPITIVVSAKMKILSFVHVDHSD